MFRHYIILATDYVGKQRIAYDMTDEKGLTGESARSAIQFIKEQCCGKIPTSIHYLETESTGWESVPAYDPYFRDVVPVQSLEDFAFRVSRNMTLVGLDVAKFILARVKDCTHLKLEKLTYFCYADYLCATGGKQLFDDEIRAYQYGPLVKSVNDQFHHTREDLSENSAVVQDPAYLELPSRSRVTLAVDGFEKCQSCMDTIAKYGALSPSELVSLTHRPGSPWSRADRGGGQYPIIPDADILSWHGVECL